MARTVYDTALLLEAVAGYDHIDDRQLGAPHPADVPKYGELVLANRQQGVKGMKIALLKEGFEDKSMSPEVDRIVKAAIKKFVSLGATVDEVSVPT